MSASRLHPTATLRPADALEPSGFGPHRHAGVRIPGTVEPTDAWVWCVYAAILMSFVFVTYYQLHVVVAHLIVDVSRHGYLRFLLYPSLLWMVMGVVLLAFRTGFWLIYRPFAPAVAAAAPALTVIIPAYNEGAMVAQAIESVAAADYAPGRLELIVIDDGSTDDTWRHICLAANRHPHLVTALQHERNLGKRAALATGFARARGDIIVTLDSDSVIERTALLALAGPFRDPRVGAVAGKVLVYNRDAGLIPRMLHVRFILAFDMLRSAELVYRTVYCCPGALTALRADVVQHVLERWRDQHFLGAPCTIGEDRAMTNFMLEAGYDTVYQRSAAVWTVVPSGYRKLCKMLLRWDRSYVREEIRFTRIVWKRPWRSLLIAAFDRFITNLRYPIYYTSLGLAAVVGVHDPAMIVRLLSAMGIVSLFNMLYFLRSEKSLFLAQREIARISLRRSLRVFLVVRALLDLSLCAGQPARPRVDDALTGRRSLASGAVPATAEAPRARSHPDNSVILEKSLTPTRRALYFDNR